MILKHREIKEKLGIFMPPAVGYSSSVLCQLFLKNRIELKYLPRAAIISLINLINSPFRISERLVINKKIDKTGLRHDPVFIIGHWRSGTTLLHSLLTQDQQMAYVSTYQSVFSDTIFAEPGKWIFKNFTNLLIPSTREGDNVKLNPDFPQEEEFALGSRTSLSFYYFWFFPEKTLEYYNRFVLLQDIKKEIISKWKSDYIHLIKKACLKTGKPVFLSKNPPNTARIQLLLDMFPNAKFIHIYRNPVLVYLSTMKFYSNMMPHIQFHTISKEELENSVLSIYKKLLSKFLEDKHLIAENKIVELSFENLEADPLNELKRIYKTLDIPGFDQALPAFRKHLENKRGYKKNKHCIDQKKLDRILNEWKFAMDYWGYDVPLDIALK